MSKYNEYKAKADKLDKLINAIQLIQAQNFGANTIDLARNHRIRFFLRDGSAEITVQVERWIDNVGWTVEK